MPTQLGQPFSPLWRGKYPHMLPEDVPVWERFLSSNPALFQRLYYDVRVGGVSPSGEDVSPQMKRMYFDVTAKRIDVLAELDKELWLIEVASRPGLRAIGQLQTYLALWFQDPAIDKPVVPVLLCLAVDSDLKAALDFYGMRLRLVD